MKMTLIINVHIFILHRKRTFKITSCVVSYKAVDLKYAHLVTEIKQECVIHVINHS